MIPHKKNDSSFLSVPVSRVGSTQRLNQLDPQGIATGSPNTYNSIPSTPSAYVSSSLNPTKGVTTVGGNSNHLVTEEDKNAFEKLSIVKKIDEFEQNLTNLSFKISSFKEDELTLSVTNLIDLNKIICSEIDDLEKHQNLGEDIKKLENEQNELNNISKVILKDLISYRNDLKKLPRLPSSRVRNQLSKKRDENKVDVNEILKYALKLSKFTKAPPTVANVPFQIHPNNYVWPAEDALRRGMLAMSSLREDDIIKAELGEDVLDRKETALDVAETEKVEVEEKITSSPGMERRASYGESNSGIKRQDSQGALDLDLFDPDEEDFSD